MVQMQSFYANVALMVYWLYVAVWNGSCYYMDYFARKYEMQLEQLSSMERQVNKTEKELKKE